MEQTGGVVGHGMSQGAWVACAACATFIDREDYDGLLKRMDEVGWPNVVMRHPGEISSGHYTREFQKQINESNVRQFRANRIHDAA